MQKIARRALVASGFALLCLAAPASAQEATRVRGTIERVDGDTYVVKTRAGTLVKVALTDKPLFVAMVKTSMADIKPGMFVGSTAMPGPDGSLRAVGCTSSPKMAMRQGTPPWDLEPQDLTSNAMSRRRDRREGQTLTMKYKGGEKTLVVTPKPSSWPRGRQGRGEARYRDLHIGCREEARRAPADAPHHLRQGRPHAADVGGPRQRNSSSPSRATGTSSG
jgi:hypothetical protein